MEDAHAQPDNNTVSARSQPAPSPPQTPGKIPGCRGAAFQHPARLLQVISPRERLRNCGEGLHRPGGVGERGKRREDKRAPPALAAAQRAGVAGALHHGQWPPPAASPCPAPAAAGAAGERRGHPATPAPLPASPQPAPSARQECPNRKYH